MIVGEASVRVAVSPADVLAFVLDLERYRQADHKIGRVGRVTRDGDGGTVVFSGRIKGMPGPSGTYPFILTPTSLKIGSPIAGPARWFLNFEGSFECTETAAGTDVVHREVFDFKPPWQWFLDPLLRKWLENDTTDEMVRFKVLVEGGATPGS